MRSGGFTMIEVLVAAVVAGVVASIAAALFGTAVDAIETSVGTSISSTREANAQRWVQDVVTGMMVANTAASRFEGGSSSFEFRTTYRVAAGWVERGRIAIQYDGERLVGLGPNREVVVLADYVRSAAFDYRLAIGETAPWLTQWRSGATTPVAIRMRLERMAGGTDTLLVYVGERG